MPDTEEITTFTVVAEFSPDSLVMDENIRTDAASTVDDQFTASLKATRGMLAPNAGNLIPVLLKRLPDGRLRVHDGARRTIGCQRAGLQVAGIIVGDDGGTQTDQRARIIGQMIANDDREGLTVTDRAAAMLALFDTGMTVAKIAKATGRDKAEVGHTLTVARSETAVKAAERWDWLTLEQAAVFAEFDGDAEALTELAKAAKDKPAEFGVVTAQMRESAALRRQRDELTAQLRADGYEHVQHTYLPWTKDLVNLLGPDGKQLRPEEHMDCPGRGVQITAEEVWPAEAEAAFRKANDLGPDDEFDFETGEDAAAAGYAYTWIVSAYMCTDPDKYGHVSSMTGRGRKDASPAGGGKSPEEKAAAEAEAKAAATAERRRIRSNNTAWRAANGARTTHVQAILGRKALAAPMARAATAFIAEVVARGEAQPGQTGHTVACELLGVTTQPYEGQRAILDELARSTDKRQQIITLGVVIGAREQSVRDVQTWQAADGRWYRLGGEPAAARYLSWLEAHTGYALTELEGMVAHGKPADETAQGGQGQQNGEGAGESPQDDAGPGSDSPGPVPDVAPPAVEIDTGDGAPEPGTHVPNSQGYVYGTCGHPVTLTSWERGWTECETCDPDVVDATIATADAEHEVDAGDQA